MRERKVFFRAVLPSMLAFALSGVYAIVDGFFLGNAMGDNALAAVNMAYPITAFLQATGTGIGMGGAVAYAICMGGRRHLQARRYFGMMSILLAVAGILLTVLCLVFSPTLLGLFGAQGAIFDLGREYLLYISFGALFQVLGTGLVPLIRNMGGAVFAMGAMMAGFVVNILLDWLLVWVIPWGMMGAAVATDLGQAVTFLACLGYFIKHQKKPRLSFARQGRELMGEILRVGLSPFGLTFSPNLILILMNKFAALNGGDGAVACYAAISYITSVVILLLQGVSDGSQPLISLSYGEGKTRATLIYRRLAYLFALAVAAVCMVGVFLFRDGAAALFGTSPETGAMVIQVLPVFLAGFLFAALSRVSTAYFYATGKNLWAYLVIYGEPLLLLVLLLILPEAMGLWGVWLAVPVSQAGAALLGLLLVWRSGKRRPASRKAKLSEQNLRVLKKEPSDV